MLTAECPDCGEPVELRDGVQAGDRIVCAWCGVELEVLSLYPWELDYALEEEWEDDWEEDDADEWEEEDSNDDDDEWDDE